MVGFSATALSVYLLIYNGTGRISIVRCRAAWVGSTVHCGTTDAPLHHVVGMDVNYGTMLTLYDVICGTAAWPRDHQRTHHVWYRRSRGTLRFRR